MTYRTTPTICGWISKPFLVFTLCTICCEAYAAAGSNQGQSPAGAGLLVGLAIAYLTRRRAIGGWLLYFYMQIYSSLLVSLLVMNRVMANLSPASWDSAFLYALFFLGTVPVLLAEALEIYAGTVLLFRRNERNLWLLRYALLALTVSGSVSLGIDIAYFREFPTIFFDVLTLGFACVWSAYFWKSKRVRLIFVEKAWDNASASSPRNLSPAERRYLIKRAAIVGLVTFVLLLLMMGGALGDKKPDAGIFILPIIYALVAAAIAWYLPIRKVKRDALLQGSATQVGGSSGT